MKFTKLVKANNAELDKVENIINNIISTSDLPINVDKRSDNIQVLINYDDIHGNYNKTMDKFDDLLVEIKIKLLQEFRRRAKFGSIYGDQIGMSIEIEE